jgi:hypothetical protein
MRFTVILIIVAICVGCEDINNADINTHFENACSSPDPMVDVEWIQELKNSLGTYDYIVQGRYLSDRVFYVKTICVNCLMLPPTPTLYDCSGTIIRKFNDSPKDQDDLKKLTMDMILYPERLCASPNGFVAC